MWSDGGGEPEEDAVALNEAFGWEYVTKFSDFHIYRSFDPQPRELHTDPAVHAMAMKIARKRRFSLVVSLVLDFLLILALNFREKTFRCLTLSAISLGTVTSILILGFFITSLIPPMQAALYLRRMEKQLAQGKSVLQRRDWRKGLARRWLLRLIPTFVTLAMLISFGIRLYRVQTQPLEDFPGKPPFVTIGDLAQGGSYKISDFMNYDGYKQWSDPMSPVNIEWNEYGSCTTPEGITYTGFHHIEYHVAANETIARALFRDYIADTATQHHYRELPPMETTADEIHLSVSIGKTVILRQGCTVVRCNTSLDNGETGQTVVEPWVRLMEQMLQKGATP